MALNSKKIISQLSKLGINKKLVTNWLEEYKKIKNEFLKRNWSNSIAASGLFAEYTVAILKELYEKNPVNQNKIHFNDFFKDCIQQVKPNPEDEILLLAVPYAAKTIYTIRNKKKGSHAKPIDPDYVDSLAASNIADYILSQFVLLKCKGTQNELRELIQNIIEKKVPLIEEFEDGTIIIHEELGMADQILIVLYQKGKRLTEKNLVEILQAEYPQKIHTPLKRLTGKNLVHENTNGFIITKAGEEKVEKIVQKNLNK